MTSQTGMTGTVLGERYRLGQRVGAGGVAEVYRADDLVLDRPVAVKLLHPGADASGAARERLRAEVRVLARLSHPGLVSVFDTGDEDGRAYLVMQLVEGGTLSDRLGDGPLPVAEVVRVGTALADVLVYLHEQRLVHRDLKPSNVLFDTSGRVLLTDFGVARLLDAAHLTATNATVGTAAYMAPEQVRGQPVGPPTDVYALGLVLVECVSGRRAYTGGTSLEVAMARLHRPPEISTAGVPEPLAGLLDAMTQTDPDLRPTARQVATRLRRHQGAADETEVLTIPAGPRATGPRRPPEPETPARAESASPAESTSRPETTARPRATAGPDATAVLPVVADEPARPWAPVVDEVTGRARQLWAHRDRPTPWGMRLDATVAAGVGVVLLLSMAFSALGGDPEQTRQAPPSSSPATSPPASPGLERLPADLDRLEQAVTP